MANSAQAQARDQTGHWVAPQDRRNLPCPHACCMGRRVHPDKLPTKLDRDYLHRLSDEDLGRELASYVNYADVREGALTQITAEVERRGDADAVDRGFAQKVRAEETAEQASARHRALLRGNRKAATAERQQAYRDEVYREWLAAEGGIQGAVMLNRKGKRAGIDERSLFTGPQSRVDKYASDELKEWFQSHPRPTRARLLGPREERRERLQTRTFGYGPEHW